MKHQTRRLFLFLALLPVVASAAGRPSSYWNLVERLNGSPTFLGLIVATTTKNNHDTATPFNNTGDALSGKVLLIQCDAAAYIKMGTANTATVTTANGVLLSANERVTIVAGSADGWLAAVAVSGTANCKIHELL